jgi:hypothetical protein
LSILSRPEEFRISVERGDYERGGFLNSAKEFSAAWSIAEMVQAGFQGIRGLSFDEMLGGVELRLGGSVEANAPTLPISSTR